MGTQIQVVLLGSATLLIQQGLSESLMGRYEMHHLWHWSYAEMKQSFDWTPEQYVWFGGYPGSAALVGNVARWKSYIRNSLIEASLSKDVLSMARIHKPAVLRRLFELGCAYSSQVVSYGKMLGQLDDAGNTTTLASYLELLNAAGLLGGLEKYAGTAIRKRSSSPKFQVHNNALMTATRSETFAQVQAKPEIWGRFVESAIGTHLLGESKRLGFDLGYWKQGDAEVDFVVTKDGKAVGIEVKSNAAKRTVGMELFKKAHPQAKVILVGGAGISWQEFLTMDVGVVFE
jgi:predicted AAA+ superfamily ATPase